MVPCPVKSQISKIFSKTEDATRSAKTTSVSCITFLEKTSNVQKITQTQANQLGNFVKLKSAYTSTPFFTDLESSNNLARSVPLYILYRQMRSSLILV